MVDMSFLSVHCMHSMRSQVRAEIMHNIIIAEAGKVVAMLEAAINHHDRPEDQIAAVSAEDEVDVGYSFAACLSSSDKV